MKSSGLFCLLWTVVVAQSVPAPKPPAGAGPVRSPAPASESQVRQAVALPSYRDLKFAPLPPIKIPQIATFTLPNGIRLYLLERHDLPLVSGVALVRTGNLFDPRGKIGLAELTGAVLRSGGTKAKTGDQIDVQLEDVAASVESQIGESSGSVSFSCLRENTDEVLGVFHDFLTAPEFREDKLKLAKTQVRSGISRRNDDPNGIVQREFSSIVYGRDNPYGWEMEYADIDNIHRQDLLDFYHRYYFPANIMLAVYGDFSAPDMKAKIEKLFSDWNVQQTPVPSFPELKQPPVPGVFLATKTDVTQTFFEIGHLGGILRDKDYPALEVAAQILGGGFSSRLFERIRTQLGYAYNIGANWAANYDHPGVFRIAGSTQSIHTVDTLREIRKQLDRLRTSEVTNEELKTAQDTVLNGFVFFFDRPNKTLNRLLTYEYYGYPKDFIFQYQSAIGKVTKTDVLRVAKEYFRLQDLTIVAVGNPSAFETPLSALGLSVQPIDLTIPEPARKAEASSANPQDLQRGRALLHRLQDALGGSEHLAAVRDIDYRADVSITSGSGAVSIKQRNVLLAPSTLRQEIQLPFGKQSMYFGQGDGWISSPQGSGSLPAAVLRQARQEVFHQMITLALSDRNPERTVSSPAENELSIADKSGERVQLTLDPHSGLPKKMAYEADSSAGPGSVEETFSKWRAIDGIQVPFELTIFQNGAKFASSNITDYKINTGITADELSKKP